MTAVKSIEKIEQPAAVPQVATPVTPMEMLNSAVQSGAGIEIIEKFMGLQERWEASQGRKAFDAAMSAAKADIGPIIKNRRVQFEAKNGGKTTNYRYEDLAQIANQINPILAKHGLSYRYNTEQSNNAVKVTCIVSHRDGYSESNSLVAGYDNTGNKNAIQAIGSAVTFLQRYTLKAALGLAVSNDDDGKGAEPQPEAISEEQVSELKKDIDRVGSSADEFCEFAKIESLATLTADRFQWAKKIISQYQRPNNA